MPKISKKTTPKKRAPSKKKTKSKKPIKFYLNILIAIFIFAFIIFLINLFFFNTSTKNNELEKVKLKQAVQILKKSINNNKRNFNQLKDELNIEYTDNSQKIKKNKKKETNDEFVFVFENQLEETKIQRNENTKIIKNIPKEVILQDVKKEEIDNSNTKPTLAILIDDVTRKKQVDKILDLPYDITMSFLPPTKTHKESARIAKNLKVAMIHLPLEATNKQFEETDTLYRSDSFQRIDKKIASLKKLYPNIKYINNHTGSLFTQDNNAMDKLIKSLKKHGYYFIDSRTTPNSVIKKYAKKYNLKYLSRNIFLDNTRKKEYIQNQLKKVVKKAIKNGYAIAIGHPYDITIKTLSQSTDILKDVQVVYIDKLKLK